jgi:hypothetical protein
MRRSLYRFVGGVAILGVLTLLPSTADANQIDFLQVGHGSQVSVAGVRSGTFMAGELNWQWLGSAPEGFAGSFYSYCVDITHNLADPQEVTARSSEGFTNGATDGGAKAAWLFNEYAAGIRSTVDAGVANIMAAALQVAIWEAMYDNSNDLGTGGFILTTTGAIRNQAQTYLNALYTTATTYKTGLGTVLDVASPSPGQDQIVSRVTEPSTLLLMGAAFLIFAKRMRRPKVRVG